MIGSPWKRPKRDRDIIAVAGAHPAAGVPEAGIAPVLPVPASKRIHPQNNTNKEAE